MKHLFLFLWRLPRNTAILLVSVYQKLFSPDHAFWAKSVKPFGHCKFHPTCSEYTKKALQQYGFIRGSLKGAWRVLRCHPWSKGGIDNP